MCDDDETQIVTARPVTMPPPSASVGMPSFLSFPDPPGLGILRSRTGCGRNVPCLSWARRSSRNPGIPTRSSTSTTVRPSTPGVRDPVLPATRSNATMQRCRVVHEVEQVVEPAAGIGRSPTVKFGLHLRYPTIWPHNGFRRCTDIHRRVFRHYSLHPFSKPLPPFPMCARALPGSKYYGGSAPPRPDRSTMDPTRPRVGTRQPGRTRAVPAFTVIRSTKEEPSSIPAASPRLPRSPSPWPPEPPPT